MTSIKINYVPSIWTYSVGLGEFICDHDNYEIEDGRAYCEQCDREGLLIDDWVDMEGGDGYMSKTIDWEAFV